MSITFSPWNPALDALVTAKDSEGIRKLKESDSQTEKVLVNFSRMNACDILRLLGIQLDPTGRIERDSLPAIARKIIRAKNVSRIASSLNAQAVVGGGSESCNWHYSDNTREQTISRLDRLGIVVDCCIRKNYDLVWG